MTWSNFMPKLFTVQDHFYIVQGPFVHDAKPLELTSIPFCTRANPHELTSISFCTRRKPPWTNFNTLLYTCKTVMQTFKNLLFTMQTGLKQLQGPFVHDAKPSCKRSRTDCSLCKTAMLMFHDSLFMRQNVLSEREKINSCYGKKCDWDITQKSATKMVTDHVGKRRLERPTPTSRT